MNKYSKESLEYWLNRYNTEEDLYNTGLEEELREKFQRTGYMTLDDLKQIVEWKFQALPGRKKRVFNLLVDANDDYVQAVSRTAFKISDDKTRLIQFCTIKGVGPALTSVILAFYDPDRYGVFDIHSFREIFGIAQKDTPKDLFTSPKHVLVFFRELIKLSTEIGKSCRDVEKALFKKNLENG